MIPNHAQMNFLMSKKMTPKKFFVPMKNFWVFEDDFIADGSFIDPISDNWKVGKIINIAYKSHNQATACCNIAFLRV
jgi:hypothetical protein